MSKKKAVKKVALKNGKDPRDTTLTLPVPKKQKRGETHELAKVTLVEFSVSAVIPTQQYGNIQPKITVTAPSMDEARAAVMPMIEDLYKTYAEMPLNGKELKFLGKVEVTEKRVGSPEPVPKAVETASSDSSAPAPEPAQESSVSTPPVVEKPESVKKAEKAIEMAMTSVAIEAIQEQIQKSVKIPVEFKPDLITLVLKKRNELKGK